MGSCQRFLSKRWTLGEVFLKFFDQKSFSDLTAVNKADRRVKLLEADRIVT